MANIYTVSGEVFDVLETVEVIIERLKICFEAYDPVIILTQYKYPKNKILFYIDKVVAIT